ncbi:poly(A) polymerase, putative [Trypanosoma brucei gambiense DAL972]|uniref:Poly(A) polymerase n=1 Tax=Trypanosoma brucei gambiense (strain MHOM/CI/86/DAL972) TaxID=679716 RepID=C9ZSW0_TRYB9|nr:poly(A) polymerase, putative [Trypanosoma brucei gambiense DAL972]CBH12495.1 poly(A) polymerase, putative [Trypanosoma brucei gambiense DAL972]|eukprot:XP_011774775.1 poly(A) polymerase, putative [Trypanosoma brucei gambiense DAL972]
MSRADKSFLAKKIISSDGPSPAEEDHNVPLVEWCAAGIEPEEEANRRRSVLEHINCIVRAWIRSTMIAEFRMPAEAAAQVEGRIFATGSYRYNVHGSGSDIDIVLIAPNRITREHFFNTLAPRLSHESRITELHCIRDARVPLIAMVADGIDIDLSFGSIRQDRVPEVITDDLLQGLDDQSVLSCNAVRVAHNIMDLAPHKASFRQALRFIKAWGKARGIYSNTFGFPSGIGWAILVAFVCQCHPNQNAAGMVVRFFRIYHTWFSPNPHGSGRENRAIYLTETMRVKTNLGRGWDPRESKSDALALFPVLTPAVPYGNACYNVTMTNLRQLCDEFARGHEICSSYIGMGVEETKMKLGPHGIWSKILEPVKFFGEYKYYLHVQVTCTDAEAYQGYVDAVESKIRFLWAGTAESRAQSLESFPHVRLRLNPKGYEAPEEVEARSRLLKKAPRGGGIPEGGAQGRAGASSNGNSSSVSSAVGGGSAGTAVKSFSRHYYFGMSVDSKAASMKVDLAPSIRSFHNIVRQLRQYRDGVTRLPVITVEDMTKIPAFVKAAAGYKDPVSTTESDAGSGRACTPSEADTATSSNGAAAATAGASEAADKSEGAPSAETPGVKRHRGEDDENDAAAMKVVAKDSVNSAIADHAGPKLGKGSAEGGGARRDNSTGHSKVSQDDDEELGLEQALGLGF